MNNNHVIFLLLIAIIQVLSEPVVVSESFTGNGFNDAQGWNVNGASAHITECGGVKMFGGYGKFGEKAVASKIFELPPHHSLNLKLQFWKIDSWDLEEGYVFVDDQLVWYRKFKYGEGDGQKCGQGGESKEMVLNLDLNVKHTGPTAVVVMTSNFNEAADNNLGGLETSYSQLNDAQRVVLLVKLMIKQNNVIIGKPSQVVGLPWMQINQAMMVGV